MAAYGMPSGSDAPASALQTVIGHSAEAGQRTDQDRHVVASLPARSAAGPSARAAESASTPVVVTVTPRPSEPAAVPPRTAAIPRDRDALARELQKELRRVGCYEGELNGAWTPATRRAMKAFTEGVNATLPVEEPDAVLLIMVQSQPDRVCGKPCPPGQGTSEDGRCLPNAILAKAAKKAPSVTGRIVAEGRSGTACEAWPRRRQLDGHGGRGSASLAAGCCRGSRGDRPGPHRRAHGVGRAVGDTQARPRPTNRHRLQSGTCAHGMRRGQSRREAGRATSARPRRGTFARTVFRRIDSSL